MAHTPGVQPSGGLTSSNGCKAGAAPVEPGQSVSSRLNSVIAGLVTEPESVPARTAQEGHRQEGHARETGRYEPMPRWTGSRLP